MQPSGVKSQPLDSGTGLESTRPSTPYALRGRPERKSPRCDNCLSAAHRTVDCYALGEEEFDVNGRVRVMESALLALSQGGSGKGTRTSDVCRLYNEKCCNYRNCKYRHVCRWCGGAHAGCECRSSGKPEAGPGPIRHKHT